MSIINIPTIWNSNDHYNSLFKLWDNINQNSINQLEITFDFKECKFLSHNGVAFLGGLVELIKNRVVKSNLLMTLLNQKFLRT